MKTFRIIVLLLVLGINATAQENQNFAKILDTYVGTWVYQKNDTVFKIKFQKALDISLFFNLQIQLFDKFSRSDIKLFLKTFCKIVRVGHSYGVRSFRDIHAIL